MTARSVVITLLATLFAMPAVETSAQMLPTVEPPTSESLAGEPPAVAPALPEGFELLGDVIVEPMPTPAGATAFVYRGGAPWANGIVPVLFEASVTAQQRQFFFSLCNGSWATLANVRCVERTTQASWVGVTKSSAGCFSMHGGPRPNETGGRQLNLNDAEPCWSQAIVLHEIGHALGFMHEHQRPDRDQFVTIRRENILAGNEAQFSIINMGAGDIYTTTYDFQSIMHYAPTLFSSNGQPTIVARPEHVARAGNFGRATLPSAGDAAVLRAVYGAAATVTAPGTPTAFQASVSGTTVNLSWGAPASGGAATSYYVTIRTAVGAALWAGDIGNYLGANGTFAAGTYVFSVQARNAAGLGPAASLQITVGSTAGARPGAPANLAATVQGTNITLSWSAPVTPGPVQTYVLHYGFTPGFASVNSIDLGNTTRVSVTAPVGTYYLRVSARNQYGSSAESNEIRVVVGSVSAPAAPSLMPVESRGGNTFRIVWQAGAGATPTSYLLDVSATPGGAAYATIPLSGTEWTGTAPRGLYYLRLRAVNAAGTSAPSNTQILSAP